jgi:hypothetical protein
MYKTPPDDSSVLCVDEMGPVSRTGLSLTTCAPRRDRLHFTLFLDEVVDRWSDRSLVIILDNLSIHRSLDTLFLAQSSLIYLIYRMKH